MLGLGFSPRCKLVRDPLNLARDLGELERIVGLHGGERRSLAPPPVKQLRSAATRSRLWAFGSSAISSRTRARRRGDPPHGVAHGFCESFGASSGVA